MPNTCSVNCELEPTQNVIVQSNRMLTIKKKFLFVDGLFRFFLKLILTQKIQSLFLQGFMNQNIFIFLFLCGVFSYHTFSVMLLQVRLSNFNLLSFFCFGLRCLHFPFSLFSSKLKDYIFIRIEQAWGEQTTARGPYAAHQTLHSGPQNQSKVY